MFEKLTKDARVCVTLVKFALFRILSHPIPGRSVEIGRQVGLKNRWSQGHEGSSPSSGTPPPYKKQSRPPLGPAFRIHLSLRSVLGLVTQLAVPARDRIFR